MIDIINAPLSLYSQNQKKLSQYIQSIGGSGRIHGCIVDIDTWNHIYLNPNDCSMHGYFAVDMYDKTIYPNIPMLLEEQCPQIYKNYIKMIGAGNTTALPVVITGKPKKYFGTDIYLASGIIKKMQRLEGNILTYWDDYALNKGRLLN